LLAKPHNDSAFEEKESGVLMRATLSLPHLVIAVLGWALSGCGASDLVLPGQGSPIELVVVSGNDQEATVGDRLPDPLVVGARDGAGNPVAEVQLVFRFRDEFPDAEIEPAERETDANGQASVRVKVGSTAGSTTVEATIAQGVSPDARALFGVTATAPERRGRDGGGGDGKDKDKGKEKDKH
jgi:hypothetical protein